MPTASGAYLTAIEGGSESRVVARYKYSLEDGSFYFEQIRYEPKNFKVRRPDPRYPDRPHAYVYGLDGLSRRPLYRLPEILAAVEAGKDIYVCEGEKDVEALVRLGVEATCNPFGAGKWMPENTESLRGAKRVVIVQDNDDAGRAHARMVHGALRDVVESVSIVGPRAGKDASDHIGRGHGVGDFVTRGDHFASTDEILETVPIEPEWIVDSYVAVGAVTSISGPPKLAGKSTFTWSLVRAMSNGVGEFLGLRLEPGPVVVLSEESGSFLRPKIVGCAPKRVWVEYRDNAPWPLPPWEDTVTDACEKAVAVGARLLIVDTLTTWSNMQREGMENDSAMMAKNIGVLTMAAAKYSIGIIFIHHHSLAGRIRGSTAIIGAADIPLDLVRESALAPNQRLLLCPASRWPGTPESLVIELQADGSYVAVDTGANVADRKACEPLLEVMVRQPDGTLPGLTVADLVDKTDLSEGTVRTKLKVAQALKLVGCRSRKRNEGGNLYFLLEED